MCKTDKKKGVKVMSLRKKFEAGVLSLTIIGLGGMGVTAGYDIASELSAHKKPALNYVLSLESRINEQYKAKDLTQNPELFANIKKSYEAYNLALSDPKIKTEYDAYKRRESAIKKTENSFLAVGMGIPTLFVIYDAFRKKKKPESKKS